MEDQETLSAVRDSIIKVLDENLLPNIEQHEEEGTYCLGAHLKMGQLGLLAPMFPEKYSGMDSLSAQLVVAETMGRYSAGFGLSALASVVLFGANVAKHGSEEQKQKYLPNIASGEKLGCWALTEPQIGSDALGVQTRSQRKGDDYILNGTKTFVTNAPIGDYFIVISREYDENNNPAGEGIEGGTAFILERGMNGLNTGEPLKKMGHLSSPTGEIFIENLKVSKSQVLGKTGKAFYDMKYSLDVERIIFSGLAIGMMEFCIEKTLQYTSARQQFSRPINSFQMIQDKIARMTMMLETSKVYLHKAMEKLDQGGDVNREAAIAKLYTADSVMKVADEAVQCHGGYGYMKEYHVERYLRDAKLFEIGAGTSEIQKLVIARQVIREFHG